MLNYIIFNGTDSRSLGIRLEEDLQLQRAEERVEMVAIPGRAGDLILAEGADIYQPYMQPIRLQIPAASMHDAMLWLRGEGYLTTSLEPDRKQRARCIKAINYERFSPGLPWYTAQVVFYCQPYKEPLTERAAVSIANGKKLSNFGDLLMYPVYTFTQTTPADFSLTVKDSTLVVLASQHAALEAGQKWRADCETEQLTIVDAAGNVVETCTQLASGRFVPMEVGQNFFYLTGVSSVLISSRTRYL